MDGRLQVQGDLAMDVGLAGEREQAVGAGGGVVDQHVDAAPAPQHAQGELPDPREVRAVDRFPGERLRLRIGREALVDEGRRGPAEGGHRLAGGQQVFRDCLSQSAAAAADDGYPSLAAHSLTFIPA